MVHEEKEMPKVLVSGDYLTKKLQSAIEAEGRGDVDLGPVGRMRKKGQAGENWWVNVAKNASPDCRRAAEDIIHKHRERYSVDWGAGL